MNRGVAKVFMIMASLALLPAWSFAQDEGFTPKDSGITLKWKVKVGKTNFRSTILPDGDVFYIGVRSLPGEDCAGVYVVDGKTGAAKRIFKPEGEDPDVAGPALWGYRLFFGSDNGCFYCVDNSGNLMWQYKPETPAMIKTAAALGDVNGDGTPDAVFGNDAGVVTALDGRNGKVLWTFESEAIACGNIGAPSSPAIADIDGDGCLEVVTGTRSGLLSHKTASADDGQSGMLDGDLFASESGIWASPLVLTGGKDGPRIISAASYGTVTCMSGDFEELWSVTLEEPDGGMEGCFSSPVIFPETPKDVKDEDFVAEATKLGDEDFETRELATKKLKAMGSGIAGRLRKLAESTEDPEVRNRALNILDEMLEKPLVIIGHSWWAENDGISAVAPDGRKWRLSTKARVSATAAIGRVLKDSKEQQIVIGVEDGRLLIISREGKILAEFKAGASVECSACLSDIDKDGLIEIIVGDRNGFVYCFDTASDGPVTWGQFRGNNMNTGVFEQPAVGK